MFTTGCFDVYLTTHCTAVSVIIIIVIYLFSMEHSSITLISQVFILVFHTSINFFNYRNKDNNKNNKMLCLRCYRLLLFSRVNSNFDRYDADFRFEI